MGAGTIWPVQRPTTRSSASSNESESRRYRNGSTFFLVPAHPRGESIDCWRHTRRPQVKYFGLFQKKINIFTTVQSEERRGPYGPTFYLKSGIYSFHLRVGGGRVTPLFVSGTLTQIWLDEILLGTRSMATIDGCVVGINHQVDRHLLQGLHSRILSGLTRAPLVLGSIEISSHCIECNHQIGLLVLYFQCFPPGHAFSFVSPSPAHLHTSHAWHCVTVTNDEEGFVAHLRIRPGIWCRVTRSISPDRTRWHNDTYNICC